MRCEFHPEALAEFEAAARYYAGCREGLDLRFIECVETALQQIAEAPARWRELEKGVRRYLTRVFPYAILYSVETDFILILAVMHCHRRPGYWRKRLVASRPAKTSPTTDKPMPGAAEAAPSE